MDADPVGQAFCAVQSLDWRWPVTRRLVVFLAVAAALAASCSKAPSRPVAGVAEGQYAAPEGSPVPQPSAPEATTALRLGGSAAPARVGGGPAEAGMARQAASQGDAGRPGGQVPLPQDRKLIRDANAWLAVKAVDDALARLRALAETAGGYVTSEQRSRDAHGVGRGRLVARVPAAKLDSTTAALKSIGTIERFQVSATDITEEYFNLELQLRNQRQLEARLLDLLRRPGNRLSDLLETERELARVRGEVDQLEGRQRFWDNRVSLSTMTVEVHEPEPSVAGSQGGAWSALKQSFSEAADNFVLAVAGIIAVTGGLIPVAVALGIVVALLVRWWGWRRRRRAAKTATAGVTRSLEP